MKRQILDKVVDFHDQEGDDPRQNQGQYGADNQKNQKYSPASPNFPLFQKNHQRVQKTRNDRPGSQRNQDG